MKNSVLCAFRFSFLNMIILIGLYYTINIGCVGIGSQALFLVYTADQPTVWMVSTTHDEPWQKQKRFFFFVLFYLVSSAWQNVKTGGMKVSMKAAKK